MYANPTCSVCGEDALLPWMRRSDGIGVLRCSRCGMGVVERMPADARSLYRTGYYHSSDADRGYTDYESVAQHSTSWAASLAKLLCRQGAILDIGCADGQLLSSFGDEYGRSGIEVDLAMARRCEARGIRIVSNDIYDPIVPTLGSTFDVVLAIAVLEHVTDIKEAARRALDVMAPEGVFIFETPLLSGRPDDEIWLRTSLEHVYYPDEAALRYLFEECLPYRLVGTRVEVQQYGSTYVGVVAKSAARLAQIEDVVRRVLIGPIEEIVSRQEITCRLWFSTVHAADTAPAYLERIGLLFEEHGEGYSSFERLRSLWLRDRRHLDSKDAYLREVEEARDYHAARYRDALEQLEKATKLVVQLQGEASDSSPRNNELSRSEED